LDSLTFLLAAFEPAALLNILTVALGLGLVIFFHELGHFAVAKWCDVQVDRFSIGFGPILLSRKWGETEYALSAIPFGGYVKMLGQDDADPSQLTSDEIAQDPRSYTAKSVPQRMAIISAGVIMNIITGLLFFVLAFRGGVEQLDNQVGIVEVGSPAWLAGIRPDDTITEINDEPIDDFNDVPRNIVLSSGPVKVEGHHADGTTYAVTLEPEKPDGATKTRRTIGIAPARGLEAAPDLDNPQQVGFIPGTPFYAVRDKVKPGDLITSIDGEPVKTFPQFDSMMAAHTDEPVQVGFKRGKEEFTVEVAPQPYRSLGLQMNIGKISAVRPGSPAEKIGLKTGDKLATVDQKKIGDEIDPLRLPEYFAERVGQPVAITVSREVAGSEPSSLDYTVTPEATTGWVEHPGFPGSPVSVTSAGFAYQLIPTVFRVDPDGPADKAEIKERDTISEVEFLFAPDAPREYKAMSPYTIKIDDDNWPFALWQLQLFPVETVRVTIKTPDDKPTVKHDLKPIEANDWFVSGDRGFWSDAKRSVLKADSVQAALALGWRHTTGSTKDIYLTLRGLLMSDISPKELHGPIKIAKVAYQYAGKGLSEFVLFLGLISINLAVINFLPIPVLDGGHMMFLLWEGLARRRPNERVVAAATYCGLFFVLGLMVFVIYQDIFGH
jgi:regulator of sigma E protease